MLKFMPVRAIVLPAYAGMIPSLTLQKPIPYGAPRVCGDDPAALDVEGLAALCSPRMRG